VRGLNLSPWNLLQAYPGALHYCHSVFLRGFPVSTRDYLRPLWRYHKTTKTLADLQLFDHPRALQLLPTTPLRVAVPEIPHGKVNRDSLVAFFWLLIAIGIFDATSEKLLGCNLSQGFRVPSSLAAPALSTTSIAESGRSSSKTLPGRPLLRL